MNEEKETPAGHEQFVETPLTPEQIEQIKIRKALHNEDKGTGSYISLADDREVLARALRAACPGAYPVYTAAL
jgi:hypothetical protein